MNEHFIVNRGSTKSASTYIAGVKHLYEEGKITHEDYLYMTGAALIMLLGTPEDAVYKWIEKETENDNR